MPFDCRAITPGTMLLLCLSKLPSQSAVSAWSSLSLLIRRSGVCKCSVVCKMYVIDLLHVIMTSFIKPLPICERWSRYEDFGQMPQFFLILRGFGWWRLSSHIGTSDIMSFVMLRGNFSFFLYSVIYSGLRGNISLFQLNVVFSLLLQTEQM